MELSVKWLCILAAATAWTVLFSCFNAPGVRGWRNLGWLACYVLGIVMFFVLPWRMAISTWSVLGILSGAFYFAYEWFAHARARSQASSARPKVSTIINGLFLWPIMFPEAAEYWLADLGVLKSGSSGPPEARA